MRSIKDVGKIKPHKLYGRKFMYYNIGADRLHTDIIYTIIGNSEYDGEWCRIEWEKDGVKKGCDFEWNGVIESIEDGNWILI